jgi:fructosamine-3-kinase
LTIKHTPRETQAAQLAASVASVLGEEVANMQTLRGGDVADAYRVTLAGGRTVFAKTHRNPPPLFFTTEAWGLAWLRDAGTVHVPEVLAVDDGSDVVPSMLVLEWINEDPSAEAHESVFGRALARLHAAGAPSFGREDRRTTGSRRLPNDPCGSWAEFYASRRLVPLAQLLRDAEHIDDDSRARLSVALDDVAHRIEDLAGPPEPPSRLHGDLWAGNRLVDREQRSWLVDPACFGGHREFDLAMMRLFGGFGDRAFEAYDELAPLADGWQERIALHHLAPLAVHALKFGGAYVPALERALRELT